MHIIFLIKNFQLSKCGLSDYISISSEYFAKKKIKSSVFFSNTIKNKKKNYFFINWSLFKIIKKIQSISENKIFFFQFSPFLQSKSGFSFKLLLIFFFLKFFVKKIKIVTNLHETANQFSLNPKYFLMYILHKMQLYVIYLLSDKIYYTNPLFLERFLFLKNKKCIQRDIISNIKNTFLIKKKIYNKITFYLSHYNSKNFSFIFSLINKFISSTNKEIYLNFIGNSPKKNIYKTKQILQKYSLLSKSKFFINIDNKKFSKVLNASQVTITSRNGKFERNSGLHKASLVHGHFILQINPNLNYFFKDNFINIYKSSHFNFVLKKLTSSFYNNRIHNTPFKQDKITLMNFLQDFYLLV